MSSTSQYGKKVVNLYVHRTFQVTRFTARLFNSGGQLAVGRMPFKGRNGACATVVNVATVTPPSDAAHGIVALLFGS